MPSLYSLMVFYQNGIQLWLLCLPFTSFVIKNPLYTFCVTWCPKTTCSGVLTVVAAQVEVAVDQRGAVVEVLGHVVQPVGLYPLHALVPVLHLQRDFHCVVLGLALARRRVVEQGQELHP